MNYLFNSSIKSIEESDFILLIGANPRYEATMVNARIRKAIVKNNVPVYSLGNPGDLTYKYTVLSDQVSELNKIFEETSVINSKLKNSKKPIFIIGVPRCGSTLIEKIIASGSQNIPIGEETGIIDTEIGNLINKRQLLNLDIQKLRQKILEKYKKGRKNWKIQSSLKI